nr:hypothetical protein [uncultured Haemophilus sp.]
MKSGDKYDLHGNQVPSDANSAVVIGNQATSKQARTVALGYTQPHCTPVPLRLVMKLIVMVLVVLRLVVLLEALVRKPLR